MVANAKTPASTADSVSVSVSFCEERNSVMLIPRVDPTDKPNLWFSKSEIHHNSMMSKIRELVQAKLVDLLVPSTIDGRDFDYDDDTIDDEIDFEYDADDDVLLEVTTTHNNNNNDNDDDNDDSAADCGSPGPIDDTTGSSSSGNRSSSSSSSSSSPPPHPTELRQPHTGKEIEERILHQKAEILQDRLNEIMELPREDILAFLTSGGLPSPIAAATTTSNRSFSASPPRQPQQQPPPRTNNSHQAAQDRQSKHFGEATSGSNSNSNSNSNLPPYNWILDSDLEWVDLPPVVRVNAVEVGYTEALWNEDSQDLPVFVRKWNDLTPNQRAALRYLGHYDEASWNRDVAIMTRRAAQKEAARSDGVAKQQEKPSTEAPSTNKSPPPPPPPVSIEQDEDDDSSSSSSHQDGKGDGKNRGETTTQGDASPQRLSDENDDNDDDDDDDLAEFISNFLPDEPPEAEPKPKPHESGKETTAPNDIDNDHQISDNNDDEDDEELAEFLSNFLPDQQPPPPPPPPLPPPPQESKEETKEHKSNKQEEEDDDLAEFISNFLPEAEELEIKSAIEDTGKSDKDQRGQNQMMVGTQSKKQDDGDDELAEFISNFLPEAQESEVRSGIKDSSNSDEDQRGQNETTDETHTTKEEDDGDDNDEFAEFISNFLPEAQGAGVKSGIKEGGGNDDTEQLEQNETMDETQTTKEEEEDDGDDELAEFISNFLPEALEPEVKSGIKESRGNDDTEQPEQNETMDETKTTKEEDNGDDDDELAEFISNFVPEVQEPEVKSGTKESRGHGDTEQPEQNKTTDETKTIKEEDDSDEELAEFISNFVPESQEPEVKSGTKESRGNENIEQQEQNKSKVGTQPKKQYDDNDNDNELAEFISNFLPEAQEAKVKSGIKESRGNDDTEQPELNESKAETQDNELDEFLSNFLPETQEPGVKSVIKESGGDDHTEQPEQNESSVETQTKKQDDDSENDDELVEFISNFLPDEPQESHETAKSDHEEKDNDQVQDSLVDTAKHKLPSNVIDVANEDEILITEKSISIFLPEREKENKKEQQSDGDHDPTRPRKESPHREETVSMSQNLGDSIAQAQNKKVEQEEREPIMEEVVSDCGQAPIELGEAEWNTVANGRSNTLSEDDRCFESDLKVTETKSLESNLARECKEPRTDDPQPTLPRSNSKENLPVVSSRLWTPMVLATAAVVIAVPLLWLAMNESSSHERRRSSSEL